MSIVRESLEEQHKRADDAVSAAMDRRDDAIQELVEAEMAYGEALEVWGKLDDKMQRSRRAARTLRVVSFPTKGGRK